HYWDQRQTCAYCDIVAWETQAKVRLIAADKHFVALSPHAAEFAFETWLIPRRHTSKFTDLSLSELHSLAVILKKIAGRLETAGIRCINFLQQTLPNQNHRFVLKIEPRTTKWAGA